MAGTKVGGKAAAATNKKREPDFYSRIGAIGGANGHTGGFAAGEEGRARARKYGALGGRKGSRGKVRAYNYVVNPGDPVRYKYRAAI